MRGFVEDMFSQGFSEQNPSFARHEKLLLFYVREKKGCCLKGRPLSQGFFPVRKKGFVISFDALVALLVLFTLLIASAAYLAKVEFKAENSIALKETAMDSLAVLEKSGKLEKAIVTDRSNELRAFLNRLPYNICADIRVFSESDFENHLFLVLRPGCEKNFEDLATVERSIAFERNGEMRFYIAEMRAWHRVVE